MRLTEKHFRDTKRLIGKISTAKIAKWLLEEGYFAEQYVLPPAFKAVEYKRKRSPYFKVTGSAKKHFKPTTSDLISVSFPKSRLTERTFGIIEPKIHHDIVWYLMKEWNAVLAQLFHKDIKIVNYGFPIPITKNNETNLGSLRAGRMIYEFIEMAETDLVSEAHKYKFVVKTDIKNFYPSIYTHSISWALHGKDDARADRFTFALLGNKLDKLFQNANDGCTNGLPIGPAISDLLGDIILSAVDRECSKDLKKKKIDFVGVRFKDDYRFLCNSKTDTEIIIKSLQTQMRYFNLSLNEGKSDIKELPEGLFRPWTYEYQKSSLRDKKTISYKQFEHTLLAVLQIDQKHPDTGVIDKFLSELTTNDYKLKLKIKQKEILKTFSLLLMLKERRSKAFPQILAIIEHIFVSNKSKIVLLNKMKNSIEGLFYKKLSNQTENQYDLLWLTYFIKSSELFKIKWPRTINSELLKSLKANNQTFFTTDPDIELYSKIKRKGSNISLLKHLAIFPRD